MTNELTIDDGGTITYGNRVVGEFADGVVTLNAGWCRLAGLGFKIDGDTDDRRRVLLDRSDGGRQPEKAPRQPRQAAPVDPQQQELPTGDAPDPEPPAQQPQQASTLPVAGPGAGRSHPEPTLEEPPGDDPWSTAEVDPKYDF